MKYIKKGAAPPELKAWFDGQIIDGQRANSHYDDLDPHVKKIVGQYLLLEQGWLCCYTGMSLTDDNFHIEHIIPRSVSRKQGTYEDVDYKNMLAAYPKGACIFGAKARGDKLLPVHPLQSTCRTKFAFDIDGHISSTEIGAKQTIKILNLDSPMLDQMRKSAIDEALFPKHKPRSEAQVKVIAEKYCTANKSGHYPKFCFVVAKAAIEQLSKIERERKRQKAIRKRRKK